VDEDSFINRALMDEFRSTLAISKTESAAQDAAGIANAPLPSSMASRIICELGIGSKQPARSLH
jgi:hypothetical protein